VETSEIICEEVVVVLDYPIPSPTALEPPEEWADLPPAVLDVPPRRPPGLELAGPAGELERVDGLIVGGLTEVPVPW
jgi:hypothetical protein